MTKLKRRYLISAIVSVGLGMGPHPAGAGPSQGGGYSLIKNAWGVSGGAGLAGGRWAINGGIGESLAGYMRSNGPARMTSGYYGGFLGAGGTLRLLSSRIGTPLYYQDGLQVGVPVDAGAQLQFSDQLLASSLTAGIQVSVLLDHLGQPQNTPIPVRFSYDPSTTTVRISPDTLWQGNTLYDIALSSLLQDSDGFSFSATTHVYFVTALDPSEQNVVLHPLIAGLTDFGAPPRVPSLTAGALKIQIPTQALADFSLALVNTDPMNRPGRVDPRVIREANQKSYAASAGYAVPISIQEITGFNLRGQPLYTLSKPATLSMAPQSSGPGVVAPFRAGALSLWALDETHRLWVKLPGSHWDPTARTVTADITRFSVFALMSGALGTAADVFVFPNPWRPHGPNAGNGPGQTGTEQGGIVFNNLPSECVVRIFTLDGKRVRELRHSDLSGVIGQETWDGKTARGEPAASGVYLWRVESAADGRNGKLMIIR